MHKPLLLTAFILSSLGIEAQNYTKYLFSYFPNNSDENIYFAIADKDEPFDFKPINEGQCVVSSDSTTVMSGLRDPHLMRGEDGYFYMVATDMRSALGWSSNRGLVLMRSKDLIHWSHHTVHFPDKYADTSFAHVTRVWAPETIWDPIAQRYMVYFSLLTNDGTIPYDRVYYCYANEDFSDLDGQPTYLFDRGKSTIDMDIVYSETDKRYHAIYKNEGDGGICMVTAASLTPTDGAQPGSQWSAPSAAVQQTNVAVEGGGLYKLIDSDQWVLMYDCYGSGYYQFCTSTDLEHFSLVHQTATTGIFTPRHGSVIPITDAEYETLTQYWEQRADEKSREEERRQLADAVTHANDLKLPVNEAESLLENAASTSASMRQARQLLLQEMEQRLSTAYKSTDLLSANDWTTLSNVTQRSGQHWKDSDNAYRYYEQNNGWGNASWNMNMEQNVTLPAGDYVLKAACRSASTAVQAVLKVNNQTAVFPTLGDQGLGINRSGQTSWNSNDDFANQGNGRGWEWRYIPFHCEENQTVTIGIEASVTDAQHQWMSVADISLYQFDVANEIQQTEKSTNYALTVAKDGQLVISGVNSTPIHIYSLNGTEVYAAKEVSGPVSISLPKGAYIVEIGTQSVKINL